MHTPPLFSFHFLLSLLEKKITRRNVHFPTYLLSTGEQNYHVFFSLCLFSRGEDDYDLHLGDAWDFAYLQPSANTIRDGSARDTLVSRVGA